jgi:cytoskeletal protein CcmA (bactofilin family)
VAESNSVSLGPNDRLVGQLFIEGDVHLNGTVEGQVEATGNLEVVEGGNVKASLSGRGVSINGAVEGSVVANDKLVLGRSASLTGDIRVARLEIRDGAKFSGNVQMGKAAEKPAAAAPAAPAVEETVVVAEVINGEGEKPKAKKR